jgi:acetylglutamate kinase
VDCADGHTLKILLEQGVVPVMAPLIHDGKGHMLNTNADTIASQVACALSEFYDVTLTFCFEKPGVLSNADDDSSVIPHITKEKFQQLVADGVISGGMLPKLENAYDAINKGVARVMITRADNLDGSNGTLISE